MKKPIFQLLLVLCLFIITGCQSNIIKNIGNNAVGDDLNKSKVDSESQTPEKQSTSSEETKSQIAINSEDKQTPKNNPEEFKIGDVIILGDRVITIYKFESYYEKMMNTVYGASSGIAMEISIENISNNVFKFSPLDFSVRDDNGIGYNYYDITPGGKAPSLTSADVMPGEKMRGYITYVKSSQQAPQVIYYKSLDNKYAKIMNSQNTVAITNKTAEKISEVSISEKNEALLLAADLVSKYSKMHNELLYEANFANNFLDVMSKENKLLELGHLMTNTMERGNLMLNTSILVAKLGTAYAQTEINIKNATTKEVFERERETINKGLNEFSNMNTQFKDGNQAYRNQIDNFIASQGDISETIKKQIFGTEIK